MKKIIEKKYIRNVEKYLSIFDVNDSIRITSSFNEDIKPKLERYDLLDDGTFRVPKGILSATRFNSDGKERIRNDKKKELYSYICSYHNIDWHGNYHDGYCEHTILRYPRDYIFPTEIEIAIKNNVATTRHFKNKEENYKKIKQAINVLLEIFGTCIIDNGKDDLQLDGEIAYVPWVIFPEGSKDNEFRNQLSKKIKNTVTENCHELIMERFTFLNSLCTKRKVIGKNQFSGYIGFEFDKIFLFDSIEVNNAIYILDSHWEEVSKLTKGEILKSNLQKKRIIHNKNWKKEVIETLKEID